MPKLSGPRLCKAALRSSKEKTSWVLEDRDMESRCRDDESMRMPETSKAIPHILLPLSLSGLIVVLTVSSRVLRLVGSWYGVSELYSLPC